MTRRVNMKKRVVIAVGLACIATGAAQAEGPQLICGLENVEDLVAIPGTRWILGSGLGDKNLEGGGLHLIDTEADTGKKLDLALSSAPPAEKLFSQCPGPPDAEKFSAHGLSLARTGESTYRLFVVNHGGRQSIEIFNVSVTDADPTLRWTGCVLPPDKTDPNSVAALTDGGVLMTDIGGRDENGGVIDGAVYEWHSGRGWSKVPGSTVAGNNGIELSADENWIFVAGWSDGTVTRMPRAPSSEPHKTVQIGFHADNIRRSPDGNLIVTGQVAEPEDVMTCFITNDPHCGIDYKSVKITPDTMEVSPLYSGTGTDGFGGATTTVETPAALWMGSFRSACIAKAPLPPKD